jgi:hypothetical protein
MPGEAKGKTMKTIAIGLGCALALAGCSMASDEDRMENAIRAELSKNGTVNEVEMTREGDNMVGFAQVRSNDGSEGRLNCTATRDSTKGPGNYNWRCLPAIDQRMVDDMEGTIRQSLGQNGEVTEVELTRQDDMRMTGHATVRANGEEVRAECTVTRENEASNHFNWRCAPAGSPDASAAPAETGDGDK